MKSYKKTNIILIILAIFIIVAPLFLKKGAEFEGADAEAEVAISEMNPDYEPWFESLWEPPSGEIESLLFAVQAALGTGVIAYYFGYMKGKRAKNLKENDENCNKNNI